MPHPQSTLPLLSPAGADGSISAPFLQQSASGRGMVFFERKWEGGSSSPQPLLLAFGEPCH